jgi:hypothetical protein
VIAGNLLTMNRFFVVLTAILIVGAGLVATSYGSNDPRPVALAKGRLGDHEWLVTVSRANGHSGGSRPCGGIQVRNAGRKALPEKEFGSFESVCAPLNAQRAPNVLSATVDEGRMGEGTVFAVFGAEKIVKVQLDFDSGDSRTVRLRPLTSRQVYVASVRRVRYGAFTSPDSPCLASLVSYTASGSVAYSSSSETCD